MDRNGKVDLQSVHLGDISTDGYLDASSTTADRITLSFVIGGTIHAFLSPKFESNDTARTIIHLLNSIRSSNCQTE